MPQPEVPTYGPIGGSGRFPTLGNTLVSLTDADHTLLVPSETCYQSVLIEGALTAVRQVVAPLVAGYTFIVINQTTGGFDILFGGSSGAHVTLPPDVPTWVTCDGTDYITDVDAPVTVTSLATLAPTAEQQGIFVDGYATPQDGGGGNFWWDSNYVGIGDGGTIVVPSYTGYTQGAWKRQWDNAAIDVRWFGAVAGTLSDANTACIQNAINAAGATYAFKFPSGVFQTTYPLLLTGVGQVGHGAPNPYGSLVFGTTVETSSFTGPIFCIGGTGDYVTPTFTFRGGLYWLTSSEIANNPSIALSEYYLGYVQGLAEMQINTWIRITQDPSASINTYILSSYGSRSISSSPTSAFAFHYAVVSPGEYSLTFSLTTTNGTFTVTTPTAVIAQNTDHYVSASYDGANMRIYVDGVFQVLTAATGTVVQNWWENVNQGNVFTGAYNCGPTQLAKAGYYQFAELQLMNTAEYVSNDAPYTPPSGPTPFDGTVTLALFSFQPVFRYGNFVIAQGKYAAAGIDGITRAYHNLQYNRDQSASSARLYDLNIVATFGCPILVDNAPSCIFERINGQGFSGIHLSNNSYLNEVRDCYFEIFNVYSLGGWSAAVLQRDVSGLSNIHNVQVRSAWQWCFVVSNCDAHYTKCYALSGALGHHYVSAGSFHATYNFPTDEDGLVTDCCLFLNDCHEARVWGGDLQNTTGSASTCLVRVDGGDYIELDLNWQTTEVGISTISTPMQPIQVRGSITGPTTGPCTLVDPAHPALVVSQWDNVMSTIQFTSDADITLSSNQWAIGGGVLRFTDPSHLLTAPRSIHIPFLTAGYVRGIVNSTTQPLTVTGPSGATVTIPSSSAERVATDGTEVLLAA
jgi:hypothetical protein